MQYLYTKETKSSFEIEHERPTPEKARSFIAALEQGEKFDPTDEKCLIALQNEIVGPRYAASDVRDFQNFVGKTLGAHREKVHFVCRKPEDVKPLMSDWMKMTARLKQDAEPVTAAALIAFTFVFIHPFEDGNGRIHRFLIHHVLSSQHYTPQGIIFPVSAAMLGEHGVDEFIRAAEFLSKFGRRKSMNRKRSSYGLKHDAEREAGDYVSNGMLIAMALAMGFAAERTHAGSPNAYFNISSKAAA